jgi:predicted metal-dependent peptidase
VSHALKISKAKTALILDQPFFATLLLAMPMIEDNEQPTFATNGKVIKFNSDFINTLSHAELIFVLAHEMMHVVFQHSCRRGQREPMRYNMAADYIINEALAQDKVGAMPKGALYDTALTKAGRYTTEGVYDLLPEGSGQGPGQPGGALDHISDAAQDAAGLAKAEQDAAIDVRGAINAAKAAGKFSKGIARLVGEFTEVRTDWAETLRNFFTARAKNEPSFARPKRRYLAEDLNLPSLAGEKLGTVAIAVDCSGSINENMLKLFEDNIRGILEDTSPARIKVLYFDSAVSSQSDFESAQDFELKPTGGGGTAFAPVFAALVDAEIECCVILTDLQCDDFGPCPDYPVLWACTERNGKAPFGQIINIRKDK